MAAPAPAVGMDTLVSVKVTIGSEFRRFKLPIRELTPNNLPARLHTLLEAGPNDQLLLERYSDSAGKYVILTSDNVQVYKQLFRAAKAKLKLRIRAQVLPRTPIAQPAPAAQPQAESKEGEEEKDKEQQPLALRQKPASDAEKAPASEAPPPPAAPAVAAPPRSQVESVSYCLPSVGLFTVCCNVCSADIPGAHWHCGICEDGDYDLCPNCVDLGHHCDIDSHFLIKRMIENGRVINSSVERIPRKIRPAASADTLAAPVAVRPDAIAEAPAAAEPKEIRRTCNCCVNVLGGSKFVTCNSCDDYDLCFKCHLQLKHGHHPGHTFSPVSKTANMTPMAMALCQPGRNASHMAICDGCDKAIRGIRNKCLNCPDWDLCTGCVKNAARTHAGHRFVPIYDPLPLPNLNRSIHFGVRCDGPLCNGKPQSRYISGVRYKCAVCHDLDYCANCEAHPANPHNRTHPMIQMKTPVQSVSVTTHEELQSGATSTLGDRQPQRAATSSSTGTATPSTESKSTETTAPPPNANASTQVQTVAESKPAEPAPKVEEAAQLESQRGSPATKYEALFERDTVPDGTKVAENQVFTQIWTLRNPGPQVWPAGCCLRFVGGDRMLNIDGRNPASTQDLDRAVTSNILDREVAPGVVVNFAVKLKAPERRGRSISYWRVKTPDGLAFGNKLWCEIEVVAVGDAGALVQEPSRHNFRWQSSTDRNALRARILEHRQRLLAAAPELGGEAPRIRGPNAFFAPAAAAVAAAAASSKELASSAQEISRLSATVERLHKDLEVVRVEKTKAVKAAQEAMSRERSALVARLDAAHAEAARVRQSQMIFPTLDKESPQASVYENAPTEQPVAAPVAAAADEEVEGKDKEDGTDGELVGEEDADSLGGVEEGSSSDEGFLTDEEYEMLDGEFEELSQIK